MKALYADSYGGAEAMKVGDLPEPKPARGEIKVRVHAAGLNPVDWKQRKGDFKAMAPLEFPFVLGKDISGIVTELGEGATRFSVGDAVFGCTSGMVGGGVAESICIDEGQLALKPDSMSHEEAASLPVVGLTSYQALVTYGKLKAGEKILIHAGAGGLGTFSIQLAKHLGAHVAVTCSTKNIDFVKSLGADEAIDYTKEKFEDRLHDYDFVYDTMGDKIRERSFSVLKQGGRMISVTGMPDLAFAKDNGLNFIVQTVFRLGNRKTTKFAKAKNIDYRWYINDGTGTELAEVAKLIEQGAIKPIIHKTFELDDAAAAMTEQESGHCRGKVVVRITA